MLRVLSKSPSTIASSTTHRYRLLLRLSFHSSSLRYLDHHHSSSTSNIEHSRPLEDSFVGSINLPKDFSHLEYSIIAKHLRSSVCRLLQDETSLNEYVSFVKSSHSLSETGAQVVGDNFIELLDLVSGFPTKTSIALVLQLWQHILFEKPEPCSNTRALQMRLVSYKDRMLYILLNTRNYRFYKLHILPIYSASDFSHIARSWNDRVISIVQLQELKPENSELPIISINDSSIHSYLHNSENPLAERRKLIVQLVVAGCANAEDPNDRYFFFETFLSLMHSLGDDHLLFIDGQYSVYKKALKFMCPPSGVHFVEYMERITTILERTNHNAPGRILNLITSIMSAIHGFSPNNVLNLWKYKTNLVASRGLEHSVGLNSHDLTLAMSALLKLRLYHECLDLYARYPELHTDQQIDVLLRVCEESKDWKMLQFQFEDMYGKGQLPFVCHYAIVMNALASIGARDEVDQLYAQFNKRKLVPNAAIFLALTKSRLHGNDVSGAQEFLHEYLGRVNTGRISGDTTAYMHSQLFKVHYQMNDVDGAMKFLKHMLVEQSRSDRQLLYSRTLGDMAVFFAENFGFAELEFIRKAAIDLNLNDTLFLVPLARAYIKLDKFEQAQEVIVAAHSESPVPYANPEVYAQQLRLCRSWHAHTTSPTMHHQLRKQMKFIAKLVTLEHLNVLTFKSNPILLEEIIKYSLKYNLMDQAYEAFRIARNAEVLSEIHFLPFFDYYLRLNTPDSSGQILKLYRRMAEERIEVTPRTYVYLMKALISLDCKARNGLENSYKLLQSILETNGLSMRGTEARSKLTAVTRFDYFPLIGKIIASFVGASDDSGKTIDIFVAFIQQTKSAMVPRMSNLVRFMIYESLCRLYLSQNQYELAYRIAGTGITHLHAIIDHFLETWPYPEEFPGQPPRSIETLYRKLIGTQITCSRESQQRQDYVGLLQHLHKRGVRLSGVQYNEIFNYLLTLPSPEVDWSQTLPLILSISETHLVAGNWVEASLNAKRLKLYKLAMLHLCENDASIFDKFKILNDFYGLRSLDQLHVEYSASNDPLGEFKRVYYSNRHFFHVGRMTHDFVLNNMPIFFVPERRIATPNILRAYNMTNLYHKVMEICKNDKTALFKLMDEYPGTIEMLFYNSEARLRSLQFRREIDRRVAPRGENESSFQIKSRAWEAMSDLIRTTNATDFIEI